MAVGDTNVSWLSHTSTNTTFLSKATDYFSHMLLQRWWAKICRKEKSPQLGIKLTTNRSWVWHANHWATRVGRIVLWNEENWPIAKKIRARSACVDCGGWPESTLFAVALSPFFYRVQFTYMEFFWGSLPFSKELTHYQMTNFRLPNCKRLQSTVLNMIKILQKVRKHYGKSCSLQAISLYPTEFSKDLNCRQVKSRVCLGKGLQDAIINRRAIVQYSNP